MDSAFKERLKYYSALLIIAVAIMVYSSFSGPRVEGGVLEFSLPNLEGEIVTHNAPQWQGKVRIVNIWGIWCPPCREEIPHLIALQERYRDQGLEIIGVEFPAMPIDSAERHRHHLKETRKAMGINYTLLTAGIPEDVHEFFPTLRNFKAFPTSIFIGRDGTVDHITFGFHPNDLHDYETRIKKLLAE